MKKEFKITKEQIVELSKTKHGKRKLKEWFPDAFKTDLEVGKWIKDNNQPKWLVFYTGIKNYGFDGGGNWFENITQVKPLNLKSEYYATNQEVEEALINEAKKRGFKEGVYINRTQEMLNFYNSESVSLKVLIMNNRFNFDPEYNSLLIDGRVIFIKGKWATIIPKKKMTKEQIENELGYKIEIV